MRVRRGARVVLGSGLLGLAVILIALGASWRTIEERWYLTKLDSEDLEERAAAIQQLGRLRSAQAAPRLIEILRPSGIEGVAHRALVQIGEGAVPALLAALEGGGEPEWRFSLRILGEIGPPALPAGPAIIRILATTSDRTFEEESLRALEAIGPGLRPYLLEAIQDQQSGEGLRRVAMAALRIDREALTEVLAKLDGIADLKKLIAAAPALTLAGPEGVEVLSGAIRKGSPRLSLVAAQALLALSVGHPPLRPPVEGLHAFLRDVAVPVLAADLKCAESALHPLAAGLLERMEELALPAVPALVSLLKEGAVEDRLAASDALAGIGPQALPVLIEALRDDGEERRLWVRNAIIGVGVRSGQGAAALLDALGDADWRVASSSAILLGALGSTGRSRVPPRSISALQAAADAEHPAVREAALQALELLQE